MVWNEEGWVTMAVPKGRLLPEVLGLLCRSGLEGAEGLAEQAERRLLLELPAERCRFILSRPSDLLTYVREGAADLGFCGKDVLLEQGQEVYELLDLGIGFCRLVVAGPLAPEEWPDLLRRRGDRLRIATKFLRVSRSYFAGLGVEPECIKLNGAIELAPLVGLADAIVDLTATGATLRANGLSELAEIAPITTRLVANPISHRLKAERLVPLIEGLRAAVSGPIPTAAGEGRGPDAR